MSLFHFYTVWQHKIYIHPLKGIHVLTALNTIFSDGTCRVKAQSRENCLDIFSTKTQATIGWNVDHLYTKCPSYREGIGDVSNLGVACYLPLHVQILIGNKSQTMVILKSKLFIFTLQFSFNCLKTSILNLIFWFFFFFFFLFLIAIF